MPQIQGIKGEAVVVYCEPLITKEMGYSRLSWKVNKMGFFYKIISHIYKGYENSSESIKMIIKLNK